MEEKNSLALSIAVTLARGAMALGARERSEELFGKAEELLEELLQSTPDATQDYSIALAAQSMAWHCYYLAYPDSKHEKYLRLSIQICEQIGAYNSDVYYRAVFGLYGSDPTYSNSLLVKTLDNVSSLFSLFSLSLSFSLFLSLSFSLSLSLSLSLSSLSLLSLFSLSSLSLFLSLLSLLSLSLSLYVLTILV